MNKFSFKQTFIDTIPVLTGYSFLGIGFGILMKASGYDFLLALFMSVITLSGSMQYAAVGLFNSGASLFTIFLSSILINARYLFYGISMIDKYKDVGKIKPYLCFCLTDETYSLLCGNCHNLEGKDLKKYYFYVSFFNHCYWLFGTTMGYVIGTLIKFNSTGIEFVMTALFITIFVEQWLENKSHKSALIGLIGAALCLFIFGKESFLIPAMVLIVALLFWFKK